MANVRQITPVGAKNISTVEKQLSGGYQAQGWALAQTIIADSQNTAQRLRAAVETIWGYSQEARKSAIDALNAWKRNAVKAAKENGNLVQAGYQSRNLARIASSATTRASEFATIVKAMDNGMTRDTLREKTGAADIENIGFHVIVETARMFNQTGATGQGRPAEAFEVALKKWLDKRKAEGHDAEVKAVVLDRLSDVLPHDEVVA